MNTPIIYFDGRCNLCNSFVDFVIRHDRRRRFRFAPLQGETARKRLADRFTGAELATVVLEEPERFRIRSDAALAILTGLRGLWRLAGIFRLIPRRLRDALYDYVARKRFEWFGRRDTCRVPTPQERERFLP
ncbi:MAG TPA: DCC1-like thiol-disulfide oxidoreductase family protein [Gemmatimonadales bacterium]|jgi:predicted DCC family thiol-disulfide oxidoreductase YuxK|nr:DCC1-like thiol-disulfide oxidoreductase family protein [Gemmatimonadales bacterium]